MHLPDLVTLSQYEAVALFLQQAQAVKANFQVTIAWSYQLLDAQEQRLFRRLSVFVGGCTLEAAESISAALGDAMPSVLDAVASLIDKNLLLQPVQEEEEPRFVMLETMREYGQECLHESREAELSQRAHTEYYLSLAERVEPHLRGGGEQLEWLTLLKQEQENLRAALRWFVEHEETERALRLSGATWWYWWMCGYWNEVLRWLEAALVLPDSDKR